MEVVGRRQQALCVAGSMAVHALALAGLWGLAGPSARTRPALPDLQVVRIAVLWSEPTEAVSPPDAGTAAPGPGSAPAPGPSEAPLSAAPQPEPQPEPQPQPEPEPEPEPEPQPQPQPSAEPESGLASEMPAQLEVELAPGPQPPSEDPRTTTPDARIAPRKPGPPGGNALGGAGGRGRGSGRPADYSAYGARLVRLFEEELDRDPVPGIAAGGAMTIVFEVIPNGSLVWRHSGRFGYARVAFSSVGKFRGRRVLKRLLRAAERFPPHPDHFPRRRYEVEFTVVFKDT